MRLRLALFALVIVSACGAYTPPDPSAMPAYQRDVVTREEILNSPQQGLDLLAALQSLRPNFLTAATGGGARRTNPGQDIAVYVNGARQPGLDALRTLLATSVDEVRYLDPMKAQNEFGPVAGSGALLVTLHKTPIDPMT